MIKEEVDTGVHGTLYSAVLFARNMISNGEKVSRANVCAARRYNVKVKDVYRYTWQSERFKSELKKAAKENV